jgi:hypothetical protein
VDARLLCHPRREAVGGAAGEILRFDARSPWAARVGAEVAAQRQLLQAHQARPLPGAHADALRERLDVLVGV